MKLQAHDAIIDMRKANINNVLQEGKKNTERCKNNI